MCTLIYHDVLSLSIHNLAYKIGPLIDMIMNIWWTELWIIFDISKAQEILAQGKKTGFPKGMSSLAAYRVHALQWRIALLYNHFIGRFSTQPLHWQLLYLYSIFGVRFHVMNYIYYIMEYKTGTIAEVLDVKAIINFLPPWRQLWPIQPSANILIDR